jgi:hypothetical protein
MQDSFDNQTNKMGNCVVCGTKVPKRDIRDKSPLFCGRIHAELAKFGTRYRGTNSGPLDRPSTKELFEKTKFKS